MLKYFSRSPRISTAPPRSPLFSVQYSRSKSTFDNASPPPKQERIYNNLSVWDVYGTPLVNIFLWGSITYFSLQIAWYKLEFAEYVEVTEKKVATLEEEVGRLKK
ncbi:8149_t:CDS:1 [Acaulospora morrowiae]|uniref:8149_t:CDS:1 n=1 Tax=Acaulospora morrowiae TaxID=94023 RepID=A0A9N9AL16_9GLOM|nr:8149_t:CDS:1 [Acaulospora morrowiae]